ncbi:MAG: hypothetical protein ACTTKD_06335 [Peptoanaerobacter stomatis]|uniref:hypothetical protein n=1 Tax=Peptoanaerobacter stomatis TaxID=796937 RepID=UPI003F9F349A
MYYKGDFLQFDISIKQCKYPVIRFEEKGLYVFSVAIADDNGIIQYGNTGEFMMCSKLDMLLGKFPNDKSTKIVVEELMKI